LYTVKANVLSVSVAVCVSAFACNIGSYGFTPATLVYESNFLSIRVSSSAERKVKVT
jgi:hypothetical protein